MKAHVCDSCDKLIEDAPVHLRVQRFYSCPLFYTWDELDLCSECFMGLKKIWQKVKP